MKQEIKERIELINKGIVPAGYKKTPVGICPIEWNNSFIGEVTKQPSYGLNKSAITNEKYPKYIRITDIDNNGKYLYSNAHVDCLDNNYFLHYGDIVFARTGATTGKNYLYNPRDGQLVFAGFLIKFSADQSKIIPSLLFYYCNTNNFWKYVNICSQRSGQPGLNIDDIQKFKINIARNLLEQQKIAEILDCATRQVELQEQLVDKLKVQKKALMQKLLTPRPDWQKLKLKNIINFYNGYSFKSETYVKNGAFYVITISNVKDDGFILQEDTSTIEKIPTDIRDYQILRKGDILISMTGNVGRVCKVECDNCLLNQRVGKIEVKKEFDKNFIFYSLQSYSFVEKMKLLAQGAAQDNMSVKDINNYIIYLPRNKEIQSNISNVLSNIDKQIELEQKLLKKYKLRQKTMMQLLLTGIVRVC